MTTRPLADEAKGSVMADLFSRLAADFLPMLSEILKEPFAPVVVTGDDSSQTLSVVFEVSGDQNGTLAIAFSNPVAAARRFLEVTIGDPEGASVDEACQEIGNQAVGRLLGALGEDGVEIEIKYPGSVARGLYDGSEIAVGAGAVCGEMGLLVRAQEQGAPLAFGDQPDESAQPAQMHKDGGKLRVLIVDDSPVMCAFLEKIFLERGYEVAGKAADGVEALEMFQKYDPDLVTLDIVMPKLKGTDVLQRIMEMRPEAAVVMATSVSDARTVMKCLKMGAKRYIIKPYDKHAVISAVEKALGIGGRE